MIIHETNMSRPVKCLKGDKIVDMTVGELTRGDIFSYGKDCIPRWLNTHGPYFGKFWDQDEDDQWHMSAGHQIWTIKDDKTKIIKRLKNDEWSEIKMYQLRTKDVFQLFNSETGDSIGPIWLVTTDNIDQVCCEPYLE